MPAIVKIPIPQECSIHIKKSWHEPIRSKSPKKLNSTEIKTHNIVIMQADLVVSSFSALWAMPKSLVPEI